MIEKKPQVEAPAFMRGKERFSVPGDPSTPIVRFSAGNSWRTYPSSLTPVC
jgi:hypothetical protein